MSPLFRAWTAVLLFPLLLVTPASAKPVTGPQPPAASDPAAENETFELEEIVVTGTHQPMKAKDTPANVSTVPEERVRRMRASDVGEVVNHVPGAFVRRAGPAGSLTTFSVRGSGSAETQVMMDGRPLNQPSVGSADLSLLPADLVDHVEVVRGPFSALYGPYAMSGALNIVSRRAHPEDGLGRLHLVAGGMDTNSFSGDIHLDLGGGPTLLVVPTVRRTLGNRPNSQSTLTSGFARFDAPLGNERRHLAVSTGFQTQSSGTPGPRPAADPSLRTSSELTLGDDLVTSKVDHQIDRNTFMDARLNWDGLEAHAWYNSWRPDFHYGYLDATDSLHLADAASYQKQTGLDLRYSVPHLEESTFTIGAALENSSLDSRSSDLDTVTGGRTFEDFDGVRRSQALYLEESLQLGPLALALGARLDHPSDFASLVSPRASLLWKPTETLSLRGGWGRGYRPPTLYDLHYPSTSFMEGNPNLRAQTSTSSELGLEATLGPKTTLRLTAFREDSKDRITWAPVGPLGPWGTPKYMPTNLDRFRKVGWEAELSAEVAAGLTLIGSHARLDAVQVNQELVNDLTATLMPVERPAANVPGSVSSLVVDWRANPDGQGLGIMLKGQWLGPRVNYYANYDHWPVVTWETKRLASHTVFDLVVSCPLKVGDIQADAFLKVGNLFDEPYALNFGNGINDRDYPMPGRTFFFGISPRL